MPLPLPCLRRSLPLDVVASIVVSPVVVPVVVDPRFDRFSPLFPRRCLASVFVLVPTAVVSTLAASVATWTGDGLGCVGNGPKGDGNGGDGDLSWRRFL